MAKAFHGYITTSLIFILFLVTIFGYISYPERSEAEKETAKETTYLHTGSYVLVHLDQMIVELRSGTTTLTTFPIVSKGKPGSYYETIGGYYINDYKTPLHFSSFGHVYMPYSVHIFGNFFIHGIPYYPDGEKVSSSYSGGCIRLEDIDAKKVYDFVNKNTPIIITQGNEYDFKPFATSTQILESMEMTKLMIATISLEFLNQDDEIVLPAGTTTRLALIRKLLQDNNLTTNKLHTRTLGEKAFIEYMNKKAQALGLTNTTFVDVTQPTRTTNPEYERFMEHINTYKSYLKLQASSTPRVSQ